MMNVINIQFNGWNTIVISINIIAFAIAIALLFIIILGLKKASFFLGCYSVNIDEASLGIGNNSVTVRFNKQDQEIAYKLWVELTTRKIALLYDKENDVVEEVFNSWYQFFGTARDLLKEIPASRLAYSVQLIKITDKVLNKELRSTLTKWQAKYRRWYELEYRQPTKETPQQIQRRYPEYSNMIADIMSTNKKMVYYSDCVKKIAFKNNTNS